MCFCLRIHENRRFSFQWWTSFQSQKQNLHDNNLLLEAESSYNPPSHKPIGILPQPGTSNHETSHNPSIPQTEISWVVSWVSNIYIFFGFFQVTLIYDYPSIAAITELVATTGTVPSGSSSEERASLSRCPLHVGYLQADQSNLCILFS